MKNICDIFKKFDKDKSNFLDLKESISLGKVLGLNNEEMKKLFKEIDTNNNGKLELPELIDFIRNLDINNKEHENLIYKLNNKELIDNKLETKINNKIKVEPRQIKDKDKFLKLANDIVNKGQNDSTSLNNLEEEFEQIKNSSKDINNVLLT